MDQSVIKHTPAETALRYVHVSRNKGYVTKCSRELTDAIAADIAQGASPRVASQANGVSYDNYYWWKRYGRKALTAPESREKEVDLLDNPSFYFYTQMGVAHPPPNIMP